jgi:hypothetical protein
MATPSTGAGACKIFERDGWESIRHNTMIPPAPLAAQSITHRKGGRATRIDAPATFVHPAQQRAQRVCAA